MYAQPSQPHFCCRHQHSLWHPSATERPCTHFGLELVCKAREGLDALRHAQASAEEAADSHAAQQPADAAPGGKARSCGSEVDSVADAVQAWSKAVPLLACPVLPDMQLELVAAHGEAAAVAAAAVADAAVAVATVAAAAAAGMAAAAADDN